MDLSKNRVTELLGHGEANAIPANELYKLAGFNSKRALRYYIEFLRMEEVILSSDAGYFLPSDDPKQAAAEVQRFISKQVSRIRATSRTLETAKEFVKQYGISSSNQQSLFGGS